MRQLSRTTINLQGRNTSAQNTSDTVPRKTEDTGFDGKIPKERLISPEIGQQIIDKIRLLLYIIMECQKIISLLDNKTSNQPSQFRTKKVG